MTTPASHRERLEESFGTRVLPPRLREDMYTASAGCPETYALWADLLLAAYGAGRESARDERDAPLRWGD